MPETQDNHRLVVSLEARIRSYERAIEKAHRDTSRRMAGIESALKGPRGEMGRLDRAGATMASGFSKSMGIASSAATGLARGIIAGGAIAAIGSFAGAIAKARTAIAEFDKISKTARTVGLTGETFQALSFGALEASVSQDKLNTALSAFVRNSGMAATGKGELAEKLRQLNPELLRNIVAAENQESRLRLVADALRGVSTASERAALATAVFGESGVELVRVFSAGAAAIDEMKRRAKDLGLIVPDDLLQRSEELDNKLSVLAKVVDVNLSTALVKLAPLLVSASEGAASFAQEINRVTEAVAGFQRNPDLDSFLDIFGLKLIDGGLADRFRDFVNDGLIEAKRTAGDIRDEIASVKQSIADLKALGEADVFNASAIDRQMSLLAELRAELGRVERTTEAAAVNGGESLARLADSAAAALDDVQTSIDAQAAEAARYQDIMNKIAAASTSIGASSAFEQQSAALADYVEKTRRAAAATQAIATAQEQLAVVARNALAELSSAVDVNSSAYQRAQRELDRLAEGLANNTVTADQTVTSLQNIERALRQMGVGEDVIARLVGSFGTLAAAIFNAKAALDAYNATQVQYKVPGGSVSVRRHKGDGGLAPEGYSGEGFNIYQLGDIPKKSQREELDGARASGGPVKRGKSYLVGEEGPEIFKPDQSGQIIPNDDIRPATAADRAKQAKTANAGEANVLAGNIRPRGKPGSEVAYPEVGETIARPPRGQAPESLPVANSFDATKSDTPRDKPRGGAPALAVAKDADKPARNAVPSESAGPAPAAPQSPDGKAQPVPVQRNLTAPSLDVPAIDAPAVQNVQARPQSQAQPPAGSPIDRVEEQTFQIVRELRRAIDYLEAIQIASEATVTAVKGLRVAGGSSAPSGGSSRGGGGRGGSGGYGGSRSSRSATSPYSYNGNLAPPGGAQYDPVSDFLYNGNFGALGSIANLPYGFNEATPWDNPFYVDRNRFMSNADIAEQYRRQGPSGGFNSGGMIYPGDSQRVEFFKNPREAVGIFTPQQMEAINSSSSSSSSTVGDIIINAPGADLGNRQSQLRLRDEMYRAVRAAGNMP